MLYLAFWYILVECELAYLIYVYKNNKSDAIFVNFIKGQFHDRRTKRLSILYQILFIFQNLRLWSFAVKTEPLILEFLGEIGRTSDIGDLYY